MKQKLFGLLVFAVVSVASVVSLAKMSCTDLVGCSGAVTCNEKASVTGCLIRCGDDPVHAIPIDCNGGDGGGDEPVYIW